jgi:hypothetical protein
MNSRRGFREFVVLSLLALGAGCGGDDPTGPIEPAALTAVSSTAQSATVGTTVGEVPRVRVTTAAGEPVSGVEVTFVVTSGGGSVTGGTATADQDGTAAAGSWTLGTTPGANSLSATAAGVTAVSFGATGTVDVPATAQVAAGADQLALSGTPVAEAPAVEVRDQHGNPVPGATVTFAVAAGGGEVTDATATTDGTGVATVGSWVLGEPGEPQRLAASVASLGPVEFNATATVAWVIAGRGDHQIVTSMDGITWTPRESPFTNDVWGVAWNGRLWVVSGLVGATLATSPDGVHWTERAVPYHWGVVAAWDGTQWVSGGIDDTALATSPDGVTWTGRPSDLDEVWGVATDGSRWVAAGYSFDGPTRAVTSLNGEDWTPLSGDFEYGSGVAWNGEQWLMGDWLNGNLYTSPDGRTWTTQETDFNWSLHGAWSGSKWVWAGSDGVLTSSDAENWTAFSTGMRNTYGVAWSGEIWVAVGENEGVTPVVATSTDGEIWTPQTVDGSFDAYAVAYARLPPP